MERHFYNKFLNIIECIEYQVTKACHTKKLVTILNVSPGPRLI